MRHRKTTMGNNAFSKYMAQMEEIISMMTSEKPIERIKTLERKINEVEKIKSIEAYKPNGKLVYFNRKELCKWVMRNRVQTTGTTPRTENEAL